jgi:hypothetical protein
MGRLKITETRYKKTGSPTEKKEHRIRKIVNEVFADLFPLSTGNWKQERSADTVPASVRERTHEVEKPTRGSDSVKK